MRFIREMTEGFLSSKGRSRRQKVLAALMAFVVFCTTYALILPAITLDQKTAETEPGIQPGETAAETVMESMAAVQGESYLSAGQQVTEEPFTEAWTEIRQTENPVQTETRLESLADIQEEMAAESEPEAESAQTCAESPLCWHSKAFDVEIRFDAEDWQLPEDTCLKVKQLDRNKETEKETFLYYQERAGKELKAYDEELAERAWVYSFYELKLESDGEEISIPEGAAEISIKYHLEDEDVYKEAKQFGDEDQLLASLFWHAKEETLLFDENWDKSEVITLTDHRISKIHIKDLELADFENVIGFFACPPAKKEQTLTAEGADYTVTAVCGANSGVPEGAELAVREIEAGTDEFAQYMEAAREAMGETSAETVPAEYARFFDIKIMADGSEIVPEEGVEVKISFRKPVKVEQMQDVNAVHFGEEGTQVLDTTAEEGRKGVENVSFSADSFSVYGVVYTVDFKWEVNGESFDFSIRGGDYIDLKTLAQILHIIDEVDSDRFISDIDSVSVSNPALVWVGKADRNTTVEELKEENGLAAEYSADLTEEEILEINAREVEAGDWGLIGLQPFDTEETLTITMKTGETFTVKVTDAHEIPDSSSDTIDVNKSYLICYEKDGVYYLLKNDGSVDASHNPSNFENLNSTYCWTFNYVFEEKHLEDTLTYVYYLIRPIDNKTKTIALNREGQELVQRSNNNVAVVPAEGGGFRLIGYNDVSLDFENGQFLATQFTGEPLGGIIVHIYEMDTLPTYNYTARSSDETRGTVVIAGGTQHTQTEEDGTITHYYEAESNSDKKNAGTITATPVNHQNGALSPWEPGYGQNKWVFDHWTQDGIPLDRDQYPQTIDVNTLPIPFNGSNLVAYFRQNDQYVVPDSEKHASSFEDMTHWLDELMEKHVPLDEEQTQKTAEVYDYENRIYRVDIASKANFQTFNGDVDMAFCMDVSNSMYFPSKLEDFTTLSIYQINDSWGNKNWLDRNRNWNNPYYLIADTSNTATVFKIYYQDGNWKAQDASRTTEDDRSFVIGDSFETTWTKEETDKTHPFNAGDDNNSRYIIYNAGDSGRNRFYYLNQSFSGATLDLTTIKQILEVAGDESPDVRIAYNTFNKELGGQREDFFQVYPISGIDLSNSHGGGTRPDQAFADAEGFNWQGDDRYVILITDGAPQGLREGETMTAAEIVERARTAAQHLKETTGAKIITVGLSLDKVPSGERLLYDIADNDKNGNKMFFMAEKASDLPNILRQITKTIMDDAIVYADVTDTVGDAFYLVDKNTGLPLKARDMIDIEGRVTTDPDQAAGVVQEDGVTVKWFKQALDPTNGWHGTLYVKAKEDLLGGNAVKTNVSAEIEATGYRMGDKEYTFVNSPLYDNLQSLEINFPTPRVNVNELSFPNASTEWTVYLGTEVDPKAQLKKLYENILVKEVVNEDGSLHYPIEPNSIQDDRTGGEHGTAATFPLAPEILKAIREVPALASKYVQNGQLNWDVFLEDIQKEGGVVVPYHLYGVEGNDSNITITLTKEILDGEETDLVNHSPHETTVVNTETAPAEKYVLTVQYNPDYVNVLPPGQGGQGVYNYNTGTYGAMYQGHAAGRETSTNTHVINVYKKTLDVLKTDENDTVLEGAVFKLYRKDEQNGTAIEGLSGKYVEVASAMTGPDGIAHLDSDTEDILVQGETYYLLESAAPNHYEKVDTVWTVEVQPDQSGKYTDLEENEIYTKDYPFNWDQSARIAVDGQPVMVIAKGEEEGQTVIVNDGSFVSNEKAISYRYPIVNRGDAISLTTIKSWDNEDNPPESITFELYRVSEKGHHWTNGRVVPCTCTEDGVREYECSECHKTETYVIDKTGHTPGPSHLENVTEATCANPGSYDTVVRCKVCNAIISSEHTETPALDEHSPGLPAEENRIEPTCDSDGGYDSVTRCTVCNETIASTHTTLPATGHDWDEWTVVTPAAPGTPGLEMRVCKNDPSHTETREIPALNVPHTVNIHFRCIGNGNGGSDYTGQITYITYRGGTGIGDMTIRWDWNRYTLEQPFDVDGLTGGAYETHYWSAEGAEYQSDGRGGRETLTIHNINSDLTIYVTIRNNNYDGTNNNLIYQPTFAGGSRSAALTAAAQLIAPSQAGLMNTRTVYGKTSGPLRAGEEAEIMSAEVLAAYLDGLMTKDEAVCAEEEGAVHTYKELAGTYTITPDGQGNWTWSAGNLPKYNEYGNAYTYYVKEIDPAAGYKTVYIGQNEGLHDGDTVTIENRRLKGSLLITKNVLYNNRPAETEEEKASVNGSYQFTVKKDGQEITGSPFTITVTDGLSASLLIPDLEEGQYTVEETGSGNLILKTAAGGVAVENNIVTVLVTAGKVTETDLLESAKAAFTNDYTSYEVIIVKVDTGNYNTRLGGAVFDLYTEDAVEDGEIIDGAVPIRTGLVSSSAEADKGKVSLGQLAAGTYYLNETTAPTGYTAMDMPVRIIVSEGRVSMTQGERSTAGLITNESAELTVTNSAGAQLPHTGGPGARLFEILGSIMLAGAAAALIVQRRRRGVVS